MSKVWILSTGDYSDRSTVAVFDNPDDVAIIRALYPDADIEEWDTGFNERDATNAAALKHKKAFAVRMFKDGEIDGIDAVDEPESLRPGIFDTRTHWYIYSTAHRTPDKWKVLKVLCWARNKEHAIKIASEILAMTTSRGDWGSTESFKSGSAPMSVDDSEIVEESK